MSGEATGTGSSGTLPKTSADTKSERRRYDVTGNIPQWITSILLGIIGVLLLMVWNAMDNRVKFVEAKIDGITTAQTTKAAALETDLAALKLRAAMNEQIVSELRAAQSQTRDLVTQVVTEVKLMTAQFASQKK